MLSWVLWSTLLVGLSQAETPCPDQKTSCPESKTCYDHEGIFTCRESDMIMEAGVDPMQNVLSMAASNSNTSVIQNAWSTPRYCPGTQCFDGSCCPYTGAACCGSGKCCANGNQCCLGSLSCCSISTQCCANGRVCCTATQPCCGAACCPYGYGTCCSSSFGQWCCQSGAQCGSSFNTCYGSGPGTKCGGGNCAYGTQCCKKSGMHWCCKQRGRCGSIFNTCIAAGTVLIPTVATLLLVVVASMSFKTYSV